MTPRTETELADVVRAADGPLRIIGGGTRDVGAPVSAETLSVAGVSGISLYEPGALTIMAQAGTPVADIDAALAAESQRLAFEPMDHRALLGSTGTPTIGGVVAGNVSGPRRVSVGACRDFLLGVRYVDGRGQVIRNGGRVMKNVTGYDLVKLMAGSWGTLGVLSEVALKVLPAPETETTMVLHGLGARDAVLALSAALGSPFDVTGAGYGDLGDGPAAYVRIEGFGDSVAYRAGQLRGLLGRFGDVTELEGQTASAPVWAALRDVVPFRDKPAVWKVSVKPTDTVTLLENLPQDVAPSALLDWGGGLAWIGLGTAGAEAKVLHAHLQDEAARLGGHATLVKGPAELRTELPVFQPEPAPLAALSRGLRQKFDPRGILNPGLMG